MAQRYDTSAPVLSDSTVDDIVDQKGVIDQLSSLSLDISDADIIKNLDSRINDSKAYWDDPKGFDLKNVRSQNTRLHLGKIEESGLYKHQRPYNENQIFVGEESIVAYVTSQIAGPVVIPASSEARSKLFASDLEKAIRCHGEDIVDLEKIVEVSVRNILNKRIAIIKLEFDPNLGKHGDIRSEALDPDRVILDKNCVLGGNPAFICDLLKYDVDKLIADFPKKKKEIFEKLGIQRKTAKQMSQEVVVRQVWVTHYVKNKPVEGVVWYFDGLVLEKDKNPNWLYAEESKNLLKAPKKPYIFGNLINYGTHLIDITTPIEQAAGQQLILNRRGRQIMENADKANGMLIISTDSGLTKDDAQNLTGDPNQKLIIKTNGQSVDQLVHQIQAHDLPTYVMNDKMDARMQIGNIMGAPTDFTGSQADDGDPTLGEVMLKKNQSAGRQDMTVRAISRMLKEYYEMLTQMFIVWYDEKHDFVNDSGNGEFDYITLSRELIEKGIRVKAGKPANPDRSRIEAIALKLLDKEAISLLDAYKILQLENPQQLYDNWAKQKADPTSLAREAMDAIDESEAYVAFADIMAGQDVKVKENPNTDYILSLRKLMINDDFLKAKPKLQKKFIDYVTKCVESLEVRTSLEHMADEAPAAQALLPSVPIEPLPPYQPPMMGGMGQPMGMPPQGMPMGAPAPMISGGIPPGMPPQGMGQPPMLPPPPMTANSVFGGPMPPQGPPPMPEPAPMLAGGPPPIV